MVEKKVKKRKHVKNVRQTKKRRTRNVREKNILKAAIKSARATLAAEAIKQAVSILDKAAERGIIHPNKAARLKSRLALAFNKKK